MIVYNAAMPSKTYIDETICKNSYSSRNYRLANIEKVYDKEPSLRKLLDEAPLWDHHNKILIDVNIKSLTRNQYACINKGWHLDGKSLTKLRTPHDSLFHIITWGGAPTVFIKHPFKSEHLGIHQGLAASYLDLDKHPKYELEPYIYHTYGEFHWHKCGKATEPCTRFFIRIIESDYIKERKII